MVVIGAGDDKLFVVVVVGLSVDGDRSAEKIMRSRENGRIMVNGKTHKVKDRDFVKTKRKQKKM